MTASMIDTRRPGTRLPVLVSVRMSTDLFERVDDLAQTAGVPTALAARTLIEAGLRAQSRG
jgi:predicted DNA-binding protein